MGLGSRLSLGSEGLMHILVNTHKGKQLNNPKVRQSERLGVLSCTLLQMLTQSPHFLSKKKSV